MNGLLTYYTDEAGEWRWRLQSDNMKNVANGSEGYEQLAGAINGFHVVCRLVGGNPALVETVIEGDT